MKAFLPIISVGVLLAQRAMAADYVTEIDVLDDIPLVNAGTRLEQRLTAAPASITVIDRDMIAASGATEIAHLFRLVPGFLSYSVYGNQLGVAARSVTPDFPGELEIMVNGRSVYQPILSTVIWSELGIDIQDIEYIEVVRGSNAPAYGSNAFFGAINIVTTGPLLNSRATLRAVKGSMGTDDVSARYSGSAEDFSYLVGFSARSNTGFERRDEPEDGPWPTHTMRDGMISQHLHARGLYTPTLNDEIEVFVGVGESRLQLPENDVRGYHNRQLNSHYQQLRWKHLQDNGDLTVNFHHNYLRIEDDTILGRFSLLTGVSPAAAGFAGQADEILLGDIRHGLSERYDLELQQRLNMHADFSLVWGAGARLERLGSQFLLGDDDVISEEQYRLFANADWRFHPRWNANMGVMVEHNNLVGSFASPRLGVNYQWLPTQMLRASATYGKRTPSLLSVHQKTAVTFADGEVIDRIIDHTGDVEEERLTALELGYLGYFLDGDLTLDMKVFKEQMRDARYDIESVDTDIDGKAHVWVNGLDWDSQGFETQVRYRANQQWLFSLQYAYMDIDGFIAELDDQEELGNHLPTHNISLLAAYRPAPDWELSSVIYHTTEMEWTQGDKVDDITRVDLRLAKDLRFGRTQGKIELLVHSAFDDHVDYDKDNIFERRIFLRVQFDFD